MSKFTKLNDNKKQAPYMKKNIPLAHNKQSKSPMRIADKHTNYYDFLAESHMNNLSPKAKQILNEVKEAIQLSENNDVITCKGKSILIQYLIFQDLDKIMEVEFEELSEIEKELVQFQEIWIILINVFYSKFHFDKNEPVIYYLKISKLFKFVSKCFKLINLSGVSHILPLFNYYLNNFNKEILLKYQVSRELHISVDFINPEIYSSIKIEGKKENRRFLISLLFYSDKLENKENFNDENEYLVDKKEKPIRSRLTANDKEKINLSNAKIQLVTDIKHSKLSLDNMSNKAVINDTIIKGKTNGFTGDLLKTSDNKMKPHVFDSMSNIATNGDSDKNNIVRKMNFNQVSIVTQKFSNRANKSKELSGSLYEEPLDLNSLGDESKKRALEESKDKVYALDISSDVRSRRSSSLNNSFVFSNKVNINYPQELPRNSFYKNKERILNSVHSSPSNKQVVDRLNSSS